MSTLMNVGCPHFEGELRKYRQADYNIYKSIYEFIDNIISKCDCIIINLKFCENEFIEIRISDNYIEGFKDLRIWEMKKLKNEYFYKSTR